jgi:hypothetical protein
MSGRVNAAALVDLQWHRLRFIAMAHSTSCSLPTEGAPRHEIHGYVIASEDGMLADACGAMPPQLRNDADWAYFQAQLDLAQLVLVGRTSHDAAPSTGRRRRVVISRSAAALEQRDAVWWWNPNTLPWPLMLAQLLPAGGRVAVPGGQGAFNLLADLGAIDCFHLACAKGVRLPGGRPVFGAQAQGLSIEAVLAQLGLAAGPTVTLDPAGPVLLNVWRRHAPSVHAPSAV